MPVTNPVLNSATPADNTGAVSTSANIVLNFSAAVTAGSGYITVSDGATQTYMGRDGLLHTRMVGATDTRVINITDTSQVTFSGTQLVLNLASDLKGGLSYSVTMGAGTVLGTAGGSYAGLLDATKLNFAVAVPAPTAVAGSAIHIIDSGVSASDYITNVATQTFSGSYSGTLASGESVQVSLDGGSSWHTAIASGNSWSHSAAISASGTAMVRVSNSVGVTSATQSQSYTYDIVAPSSAGSAVPKLFGGDPNFINDDSPTVYFYKGEMSLSLGDVIEVLDLANGGAVVGTHIVNSGDLSAADTSINVDLNQLAEGAHQLTVRVSDAAGNHGTQSSASLALTVDLTVASMASRPLNLADDSDVGSGTGTDNVTTDTTPTLTISLAGMAGLQAGDALCITDAYSGDVVAYRYLESGDFAANASDLSITLTTALYNGVHPLTAYIRDSAGNYGTSSAPLNVTIEGGITAPPTPVLTLQQDTANDSDHITTNGTVLVSGLVEGNSWRYLVGYSWHIGSGNSFTLPEGTYYSGELQVEQYLGEGPFSQAATLPYTLTVDTSEPSAALLRGEGRSLFDTGGSSSAQISLGAAWSVAWEAGVFVEYTTDNGNSWHRANSNTASGWEISGLSNLVGKTVGLRVSDTAGNTMGYTHYMGDSHGGTFQVGSGDDLLTGDGVDVITASGSQIYIEANGGDDTVTVTGSDNWVYSGSGNDVVAISGDDNEFELGAGDDHLTLSGAGNNGTGGDGSDTITYGGALSGAGDLWGGGPLDGDLGEGAQGFNQNDDTDTLVLTMADQTLSLSEIREHANGFEQLRLGAGGTLSVSGEAAAALSDSDQLTILGDDSNTIELDSSWTLGASDAEYTSYSHAYAGVTLRLANAMQVEHDAGSGGESPAAPVLELAEGDLGMSDSDHITSNYTVSVSGLTAAYWSYSVKGVPSAQLSTSGSSATFNLEDGVYAPGEIQVWQYDTPNLKSTAGELSHTMTVDTTAETLTATSPGEDSDTSPETNTITLTFSGSIHTGGAYGFVVVNAADPFDIHEIVYEQAAGDTLSYNDDNHTVTINLGTPLRPQASYSVMVNSRGVLDAAGNLAYDEDHVLLQFNTTAAGAVIPAAPTVSFTDSYTATDPGGERSDGITSDYTFTIEGLVPGGTWAYRLSSSGNWVTGSGSTLTLTEDGIFSAGELQVRQTANGIDSVPASLGTITVDTDAPSSRINTGTLSVSGTAVSGTFSVAPGSDTVVELTFDNGVNWTRAGHDSSGWSLNTTAAAGSGVAGVRIVDKAGNQADNGVNGAYTIYAGSAGANTFAAGSTTVLLAGAGNDTVTLSGSSAGHIDFGDGDDTLILSDSLNLSTTAGMFERFESIHLASGKTLTVGDLSGISLLSLSTAVGYKLLTVEGAGATSYVDLAGSSWIHPTVDLPGEWGALHATALTFMSANGHAIYVNESSNLILLIGTATVANAGLI